MFENAIHATLPNYQQQKQKRLSLISCQDLCPYNVGEHTESAYVTLPGCCHGDQLYKETNLKLRKPWFQALTLPAKENSWTSRVIVDAPVLEETVSDTLLSTCVCLAYIPDVLYNIIVLHNVPSVKHMHSSRGTRGRLVSAEEEV